MTSKIGKKLVNSKDKLLLFYYAAQIGVTQFTICVTSIRLCVTTTKH